MADRDTILTAMDKLADTISDNPDYCFSDTDAKYLADAAMVQTGIILTSSTALRELTNDWLATTDRKTMRQMQAEVTASILDTVPPQSFHVAVPSVFETQTAAVLGID